MKLKYDPAILDAHERLAARMNTVSKKEADAARAGNYVPFAKRGMFKVLSHDETYSNDSKLAVVFTTLPPSENITDIADGLTECVFHFPKMKQGILNTPGFPQSVPVPSSPKPYSIVRIPFKGLGMIATRDLRFGDLIVAERALLISCRGVQVQAAEGTMTQEQMSQASFDGLERWLECAIERMESDSETKKYADAYKKLCNSHLHDGSGPLTGILRTNCYGVGLPLDEHHIHAAVFDKLSRINHSCSPNTMRSWNTASLSMQLYAIRDIKKGEEITTWYEHPGATSSKRRSHLTKYDIDCQCRACTEPSSDRNRARISNIKDSGVSSIARWAGTPSLANDLLLKPALEMLKIIEEEGVEVVTAYARVLHQLVLIYYVLGEMAEAKRYHQQWRVWQRIHFTTEMSATLEACFDILNVSKASSARL